MRDRRPKIPVKTQVDIAIRQARGFDCVLCHKPLYSWEPRILEHLVPRALFSVRTDGDSEQNLGWAHAACADHKTRGCTGTSKKGSVADGDLHKLAKAKRHEKERVTFDARSGVLVDDKPLPPAFVTEQGRAVNFFVPGSRKLRGKGFDKTMSKGFDGKVRKRKGRRSK